MAERFGPLLMDDAENPKSPESPYARELASTDRKMAAKWRRVAKGVTKLIGRPLKGPPDKAEEEIMDLYRKNIIPCVAGTKAQKRVQKFREKMPTRSDFVLGLKENIEARLAFMLPNKKKKKASRIRRRILIP